MVETTVLFAINLILCAISIACAIIVLLKLHKNNESRMAAALGVSCLAGIGFLLTFLAGLRRANKLSLENLLCAWTLSLVAGIGISALRYHLISVQIVQDTQRRAWAANRLRELSIQMLDPNSRAIPGIGHHTTRWSEAINWPTAHSGLDGTTSEELLPSVDTNFNDQGVSASNDQWWNSSNTDSFQMNTPSLTEGQEPNTDTESSQPTKAEDEPPSILRLWLWPYPITDRNPVKEQKEQRPSSESPTLTK